MSGHHGINFIGHVFGEEHVDVFSAAIIALLVALFAVLARKQLKNHPNPLIPDIKLTAKNFTEILFGMIVNLADNVMGKDNRKYIPFVATIFFYIMAMNLLGLIPGFSMPTVSFKINFGIAAVVFLMYNFWGLREVGVFNYLKHLWGPVFLLGPILFFLELISHLVRPITLSLRLFGNMTGDHLALAVFTDLTKLIVPIIFYALGTFVCLIQAFVFTVLTMVYIRLAVVHEGSGDHH